MPKRPETERTETPDMEAARRARESEFGAAPKAATTPLRGRREEEPARPGHDEAGEKGAPEAGTPPPPVHEKPAPEARPEMTRGAERAPDGGQPAKPDARLAAHARPGKPAKPGKGARPHRRQPMIQRVEMPDFPDFPEPAELERDKIEGREDSPQVVRAIAVGIPILALIGGGAFMFGFAALGSAGQFPFSFAVGLIAVLCMMGGVTVIALNLLHQSQKVGKQTDELLSRYFEPETAAVKTVATLGEAIRREMEKLSGNLDGLASRVESIEKRLQEQSDELGHAMDRLEQRAKTASQTLADERERLEDTARSLNDQTQSAAQALDEQISTARTVIDQASGKLGEADKSLKERIAALGETAQSTSAGAEEASGILEKQARLVSEISQSALDAAKRAADRYQNQHRLLTEAIDRLTEEAGRMDRVFDTQRQSLRDIADATAKQSERIEEVLGKCARDLEETLDSAANRARSIGSVFTEQSESIQAAGEDATGAMNRAADAARMSADDTRKALEAQIQASQATLEEQLSRARAALGGLTEETAAALERQLESSRGALDALLSGLRGLVDSRLQQARGLFDAMIGEFDRTILAQITALREHRDNDRRDWDAWRDRIGTALEGVRLQARDSLKLLNETATEVEERLGALPARVIGGSNELRKTIADQVAVLDSLVASAQNSVTAIEGLMAGLPGTLSASSEAVSGRIAAQAQAIEELATTARARMGDIENMFERLPRQIDGQAAHIRKALDAQTQRVDQAASLAARRARDVAQLKRPDAALMRPPAADTPTASSGAPPAVAKRPPAGNGAEAAGAANRELSVQEIPARQQAPDAGSPTEMPSGRAGDMPPPVPTRPRRPVPPQADIQGDGPSAAPRGDSFDIPPRSQAPAAAGTPAHSEPDPLAASPRPAQQPPHEPARPERRDGSEEGLRPPSFLRRPADSGRDVRAPDAAAPGRARVDAPGDTQPERPKPIFNKRFIEYDEPPAATADGAHKVPDDPVSIRKGAVNVQRPHPAAARRALMRDASGDAARDGNDDGQDHLPPVDPPPLPGAAAVSPEPDAGAGQGAAFTENPFTDFGPPPIPGARRQSADRRTDRKPDRRETQAEETATAKSGRLGWSDILAAAERASHEDGIPEAETGLDPEAEKARSAIPEGPSVGTPELQAIAREIVSILQTLSLDLRPVWRETIPMEVVRRFLAGDKRALTRRLPVMGGMETMTRIRRRYRSEPRFRASVDRFVQEFDVLVDQIHGLDAARAEKYMSSQNGRLFILLKQVLSKS